MRRGTKQVLDRLLAGGLNREEAVAGVAEAAGVVEWPKVGEGLVEDAATAVLVGAPGGWLLTRKRVGPGGTVAGTGPRGASTTVPKGNKSKGATRDKQTGRAGLSQTEQDKGGKSGDGEGALGAEEEAESGDSDQPLLTFGGGYRLRKRPVERVTSRAKGKGQRRVNLQGRVTAGRVLRRGEVGPRSEVQVSRRRGGKKMFSPKRSDLAKRRKVRGRLKRRRKERMRSNWLRIWRKPEEAGGTGAKEGKEEGWVDCGRDGGDR
jgi:hypothetical protein